MSTACPVPGAPAGATPQPLPDRASAELLRWLAESGLLSTGVPQALGGRGGRLTELQLAGRWLWAAHPAAAAVWRAQRLAIEALVHARNLGLAEYLLPQLLAGERAGSVAAPLVADVAGQPLVGHDSGQGWRLSGLLPLAANLLPEGFTLVAPVCLGNSPLAWVALRGEEDGLDVLPPHPGGPLNAAPDWARAAALGDVRCRHFHFREDEWLADADLLAPLQAAHAALSAPGAWRGLSPVP